MIFMKCWDGKQAVLFNFTENFAIINKMKEIRITMIVCKRNSWLTFRIFYQNCLLVY